MVGKTPPMGWNSWNTFGKNINEQLILETADAMVEKGYRDAGYEYVVIDDCWSLRERVDGKIVADPEKFPHGMKYIGDYIHSKGLKFGMYSATGARTCAGYPGSFGHEYEDAQMFADWGVDYLKYDLCHFPGCGDCRNSYLTMGMALRATGRDILYAVCSVGQNEPEKWTRSVGGHMYRSTGDIVDKYESFRDNAMSQYHKLEVNAPGCYNDIDMLVVGMHGVGNVARDNGCTDSEYQMHFALWCLYNAPLMIGGDIRNMNDFCHDLLTNRELIAINKDPECRPLYFEEKARYHYDIRLGFLKLLDNNKALLSYFNFSDDELEVPVYFDDYGVPAYSGYGLDLTDVITGEHIGPKYDFYCPRLEPRSCRIYKAEFVRR